MYLFKDITRDKFSFVLVLILVLISYLPDTEFWEKNIIQHTIKIVNGSISQRSLPSAPPRGTEMENELVEIMDSVNKMETVYEA